MHRLKPTVSVLLPVYNGEKYLSQAIDSILNQTFQDFELLIADDGSEDRSWQIANRYKDTRILLFQNESNLGIANTLQGLIRESRGNYIARMDADDISMPGRLEKQVAFMESHPSTGLLGTGIRKIKDSGQMLKETWLYPGGNPRLQWLLFFRNPFAHSTVMIQRTLLDQVGGYINRPAEDFDLWERLSWITTLDNLQEALVVLRKHQSNLTVTRSATLQEDSKEIISRRIQKLLGSSLSHNLPAPSNGKWLENSISMAEYIAIIDQLMITFVREFKLSREDQAEIQSETAKIILKSALKNYTKADDRVNGILKAHQYDPKVCLRLARNRLAKVKR